MTKNLCIIPARGGSKRIPRKNIKDFLGKPIIAYSIEIAIQSEIFDEVMVSTDDTEIASIAKDYGAKVPFMRSSTTANDHATTFKVVEEVLSNYRSLNKKFNFVCCLYSCTPLVTLNRLVETFQLLTNSDFDSTFPVMRFGQPIQSV